MSLSPHKLIEISRDLIMMAAVHTLQLLLGSIPIAFHMLCVDTRCTVNKLNAVVDCGVLLDVWQCTNLSISPPLIRMDNTARSNMIAYQWQKGCCIPLSDTLDISKSWLMGGVNNPKHPLLKSRTPTPMMLWYVNSQKLLVNVEHCWKKLTMYSIRIVSLSFKLTL